MKISKTQIKQIIEEELEAVLSEDELEEVNLAALNLLQRMQKKRQGGPGASSVDTHKRALAAKEKTQAQRDKERKDKEEKERKEYDRRWRASLSPEDLAAEEEAEAYRQSFMMEGLSKAKLKQMIKEELEVTLTNEEAGELFGETVEEQLEGQEVNEMIDLPSMLGISPGELSDVALVLLSFGQIAANLAPAAILGGIGAMLMGPDKEEKAKEIVDKAENLTAREAAEMRQKLTKRDAMAIADFESSPKRPMTEALNEDGHSDIPSACRKLKTSIEDASDMLRVLEAADPEGNLPSWWMSKVTLAANYLNKARDYLLYQ